MTKEDFLGRLKKSLRGVGERSDIVADYEEHFRIGAEKGKAEGEIAASLGNPKTIGKSYRIDSILQDDGEKTKFKSVVAAVFASISLGFFNLVFILGPFLALAGVLIGMWAAALSLGIAGAAALLGIILQPVLPESFSIAGFNTGLLIFGSIGSTALGFLAVLGMWQLTRVFANGTGKFLKFNAQFIRRSKEKSYE